MSLIVDVLRFFIYYGVAGLRGLMRGGRRGTARAITVYTGVVQTPVLPKSLYIFLIIFLFTNLLMGLHLSHVRTNIVGQELCYSASQHKVHSF